MRECGPETPRVRPTGKAASAIYTKTLFLQTTQATPQRCGVVSVAQPTEPRVQQTLPRKDSLEV